MKSAFIVLLILFNFPITAQKQATQLNQFISESLPRWYKQYQHLHANPEISFQEKATAESMAEVLRGLGFEVTEGVGGYGVVGVLKNGNGPTVMVRTDTDALPIIEETGLSYASKATTIDDEGNQVGVMHACGHDLHMTVWSGTAELLVRHKDLWKGTVVFIAQPAEERSGGAKAMLADGLFEKFPRPEYALALHTHAALAAGKIGYVTGYMMANVDFVKITVYGKGGHGAYPHTTKDPIVLAAQIIMDLQTIVSREISPLEPAVVTVGKISGGTKANIIPDQVDMELTLRSYSDEVKQGLIDKIRRICNGAAMSAGLPETKYPEVWVRPEDTPAVYNDPELTTQLAEKIGETLGEAQVVELKPVMGGEDFSRYGKVSPNIPICMLRLGVVSPEQIAAAEAGEIELPSLHSAKFAPEAEPAIETGVKAMSAAVLHLLSK
ncbi:MAG: putative amidohydrolase [Cyclobacteriaceae bacterium]|nr:MAG: putative amidohydrolase [Cyclobacteriaceae bacterium]